MGEKEKLGNEYVFYNTRYDWLAYCFVGKLMGVGEPVYQLVYVTKRRELEFTWINMRDGFKSKEWIKICDF